MEASSFRWTLSGQELPSNVFRYQALNREGATVLAESTDGKPIVTLRKRGEGQLITIGVPLGLGIDKRPVPILGLLMRHLARGAVRVNVSGDVEWSINRTPSGYVIALLNNRGVIKPQHGVVPTDHREQQEVQLLMKLPVRQSSEWVTESVVEWHDAGGASATTLTIPAGAVRLIEVEVPR